MKKPGAVRGGRGAGVVRGGGVSGARVRATDPRADALKQLTRYAGGVYDACVTATRVHREDAPRADREAAVGLLLRRAERLALDLVSAIARVPK